MNQPNMKRPTNQKIVGGFNRKEKWAFGFIYDDCETDIFELSFRILKNEEDARDLTNDMFFKLQRIEKRLYSIKKIHDAVYLSAKNLALDRLKKRQTELKYISEQSNLQAGFTEAEMFRNETGAAIYYEINRCLHKLTPQCQKVFDLYFIHQKSVPEIATEMKISIKTVSNSKSRALRVMRLEIVPRKSFIFFLNILS
jgi:RNA polymerase sigma-70 factor (ECF subfamily)